MIQAVDFERFDEEDLVRLRIPMAPPLRWVNSYLLRGPEGVAIVDPGPRSEASEAVWEAAWDTLGVSPDEVVSIVLTHHHPDHYGLAGYLQSLTGAEVYMSERAYEETGRMWGAGSTMNEALPSLYRRHGMPEEWSGQLPAHLRSFFAQVTPPPSVRFLKEGDHLVMGGRRWMAIETGGHAPGHLSLYEEERRLILCGDAVLPQISPNVSLLPGSDPQPLQTFMASLAKLRAVEVAKAFPGHRNPFPHFAERCAALIAHHEERLAMIEALLARGEMSGFEVCAALFGTDLGIHQMRFAMSEALAHLVELVRRGRAVEEAADLAGTVVYRLA